MRGGQNTVEFDESSGRQFSSCSEPLTRGSLSACGSEEVSCPGTLNISSPESSRICQRAFDPSILGTEIRAMELADGNSNSSARLLREIFSLLAGFDSSRLA